MSILSNPPAGLRGCETVFRYVEEGRRARRAGEWWQIWYDGVPRAGPSRLDDVIRLTFSEAGQFDLEARDAAGEVLHVLRYHVAASPADELNAVAACAIPETQQQWVNTIRERGRPDVAELESLIKDRFLKEAANRKAWGQGTRLLLCLYRPELLRVRWARTTNDQWEEAFQRVQLTLLRRRDFEPERPFRPYAAKLLERELVNGHRGNGQPDPDNPGGRRPLLDVDELAEPEDPRAPAAPYDDVDLDRQPVLLRLPNKLREGIRLSEAELTAAARRNLEFAWEPRRRRPWTLEELEARAVRDGTTLGLAMAEQMKHIRGCETRFRRRDNRLPEPFRDEEDPAWEKEQRRLVSEMRQRGEAGRDSVGVLNEDALQEVIPWYSGSGHSRATTLFQMRQFADQMTGLFEGPLARARGPRLQKLGEEVREALGDLIDGYGREAEPFALRRYSRLVEAVEGVTRLFDPRELEPDDLQILTAFRVQCDAFCGKLRALQRLYPARRLLRDYLGERHSDWPLLGGLAAWLERGGWRNHLSPDDRMLLERFASHLLETRRLWPADDAAALHLLQGWLSAVARDDETAVAWLTDLDACWRHGLEAVEVLRNGSDPVASLVRSAARWWGRPTPRSHKAVLEWACRLEDVCREGDGRAPGRGAVDEVARRVRSFRERVVEIVPGRDR
jgi:hypothetical protein